MKRQGVFILGSGIVVVAVFASVIAIVGSRMRSSATSTNTTTATKSKSMIQAVGLEEIKDRLQTSTSTVTLVNLWASWCEPCKVELPGLLKLRESLKDKGFDLMLVSLDQADQEQDALDFLKDHGVTFPTYIKGDQPTGFIQPLFPMWNGAIPASFLVNRELQILEGWIGETRPEEFEAKIVRHLPKP